MNTRALLRGVVVCGALLFIPQLFGAGITNPTFTPCASSFRLSAFAGGPGGCTIAGEFTLSGFQFSKSALAPLNALDITVTPTFTVDINGVVVDINLVFGAGMTGFTNPGSGTLQYTFDYILDPARPILNGAGLSLDPGGFIEEDICAGGIYTPNAGGGFSCAQVSILAPTLPFLSVLGVNDMPPTPTPGLHSNTSFIPQNVFHEVDYHVILTLPPGATAGGFSSETITALAPGDDAVPEPSATLLGGCGLLALLGFRSRAKLRKVALQFFS